MFNIKIADVKDRKVDHHHPNELDCHRVSSKNVNFRQYQTPQNGSKKINWFETDETEAYGLGREAMRKSRPSGHCKQTESQVND